jgi:hypothetical protein
MGTQKSCHAVKGKEGEIEIKYFGLTQSQRLKAKYLGIDIKDKSKLEGKGAKWMETPIAEAKEKYLEERKRR